VRKAPSSHRGFAISLTLDGADTYTAGIAIAPAAKAKKCVYFQKLSMRCLPPPANHVTGDWLIHAFTQGSGTPKLGVQSRSRAVTGAKRQSRSDSSAAYTGRILGKAWFARTA